MAGEKRRVAGMQLRVVGMWLRVVGMWREWNSWNALESGTAGMHLRVEQLECQGAGFLEYLPPSTGCHARAYT